MSLWLATLLAGCALAAPVSPQKTTNPSQAAVDWLRIYPMTTYREFWTLEVEVRDLKKDLPRVMQALEQRGGTLAAPLANSAGSVSEGTQQLSYRLTISQAKGALKDLRKLGTFAPPLIRPAGERLPVAEIKTKIAELSRDKQQHGSELARMPAVSALVESVLSHLVSAEAIAERVEAEVVLNLTVEEKKPAAAKKP